MKRCVFDGLPCGCNDVEAFVNCHRQFQHEPAPLLTIPPVLDQDFDQFFGMEDVPCLRH